MRKVVLLLLLLTVAILLTHSAAVADSNDLHWETIKVYDEKGDMVEIQVYGYWEDAGQAGVMFIVCDPDTGEPLKAYIPQGKTEKKKVKILKGYEEKEEIDYDTVKKIEPVKVESLFAPNVCVTTKPYFDEDGEYFRIGRGSAQWPGDYSFARLLPGSDPDYWLIAAAMTNPNGFPVKAKAWANLYKFIDGGSYHYQTRKYKEKEILLKGYETKILLVSRGFPYDEAEDVDEPGSLSYDQIWNGDSCTSYSLADFGAQTKENQDPELPDNLKPSWGFIEFSDDGGWVPEPVDLSGGIPFEYRVRANGRYYADWKYHDWRFNGAIRFNKGIWEVSWLSPDGNEATDVAKQKLADFFTARTFTGLSALPRLTGDHSETIDGINYWKLYPMYAYLEDYADAHSFEKQGPSLLDYREKVFGDLNPQKVKTWDEGGIERTSELYPPKWKPANVPVVKAKPAFVEWWTFEGETEGEDVGELEKEVKPGFIVWHSQMKRPYFEAGVDVISGTATNVEETRRDRYHVYYRVTNYKYDNTENKWNVTSTDQDTTNPPFEPPYGESTAWKTDITFSAVIKAVNPDSDYPVKWKKYGWSGDYVDMYLPPTGYKVSVSLPIELAPQETKVVYNAGETASSPNCAVDNLVDTFEEPQIGWARLEVIKPGDIDDAFKYPVIAKTGVRVKYRIDGDWNYVDKYLGYDYKSVEVHNLSYLNPWYSGTDGLIEKADDEYLADYRQRIDTAEGEPMITINFPGEARDFWWCR
ncbi:MAG: hypothetical protein C4542_05510 [Dehalococcoidia bacterium]|nr:MAG: hypothetical protein C4542_05510 [Dehalococcoidia bacterium]